MVLSSTVGLSHYFVRVVRKGTAHLFTIFGIFTALALVHLLLFALSRQHRDHLFFAAFAGSVAASLFARAASLAVDPLSSVLFFYKISSTFTVAWAANLMSPAYTNCRA